MGKGRDKRKRRLKKQQQEAPPAQSRFTAAAAPRGNFDVDAAIAELQRSVNDLGLVGAYIGTDFGMHLDDERLDPFYAACVELDVPLFLHPAPTGLDGEVPHRDFDDAYSGGLTYWNALSFRCLGMKLSA